MKKTLVLVLVILAVLVGCKEHEHSWKLQDSTPATCLEDGWAEYKCDSCGAEKTDVLEALGHKLDVDSKCENCHEEINAAKIGDVECKTLVEAINAAKDGEIVTLLWDASGAGLFTADSGASKGNITIDFNGHTYTMVGPTVGSTGTETQAMHWGASAVSVTMKNGTFKVAADVDRLRMAMQNYIKFNAENMVFDFTLIEVGNFGEIEYSGSSAIYNGREVPLFNNNRKGVMNLDGCKVMMPLDSKMGISADGASVTLKDTAVDGFVNFQDIGSNLTRAARPGGCALYRRGQLRPHPAKTLKIPGKAPEKGGHSHALAISLF